MTAQTDQATRLLIVLLISSIIAVCVAASGVGL
jgi:hypothetical protein